jgi:hypothetical protein
MLLSMVISFGPAVQGSAGRKETPKAAQDQDLASVKTTIAHAKTNAGVAQLDDSLV